MTTNRLTKALSEKMILLAAHQTPEEWKFKVRGSSSSIYEQLFTKNTYSCTCQDHVDKKTFCKHLLFLVARVAFQLELAATLSQRPKTTWKPTVFSACVSSWQNRLAHLVDASKPILPRIPDDKKGTCSICFEEMEESQLVVECKKTCHNWFHSECMDQWLTLDHTTCPLCRSDWSSSDSVSDPLSVDALEEKIQGVVLEDKEVKEIKTDLVISFDTTGSMYPCLAEVKRNIQTMSQKLFHEIPGLRLSIIAHGDYCDGDKVISILDFTTDQEVIKQFIDKTPSTGGGDYPECYELVLRTVKTLSWRTDAQMKSLVLIGDAPPHEKNENPQKIDWRVEAESLNNRNIQVFSVQCLNNGNREAFDFYSEVSKMTNGYHVFLNQFSHIKDMIQAICFKQYNQEHLEQFEREIQSGSSGMNQTLRLLFDTILGKKTREEVHHEMHPDRFRERYHRPERAAPVRSHSSHTESAAPSLVRESELRPCHPSKFQVLSVDEECGIKEFCVKMGITFQVGRGFYEFIKPEIVQPKKEIVLMHKDTGELFEGDVARTIAGISENEERSKIKPGDLPKYRIFIQSTSPSRKLVKNQGFLYEVMHV